MLDDVLIFGKIKNGDIHAFEILFRRYYERLCQYSYGFVGTWEDAEEIVQELFYKIWKERENYRIAFSVKSYLYGAVRNNSLQYLEHLAIRQNYRERELNRQNELKIQTPEEELEYKDLEKQLEDVLNRLPKRQRQIFTMNRFEGKKYAEIAEILSLSVKTIEAEMSKALRILKLKIENE